MVLQDSRSLKDSNGISFAKFGRRDQKIWIKQDSVEIWFEFLFWNLFEPEIDTYRYVIGWYRFGWIAVVERRIKRWSDGSDQRIPLHLSDGIWATRSGSDDQGREEETHRLELGFWWGFTSEAALVQRLARFWRLLDDGEDATAFSSTRWSWKRAYPRRLRPVLAWRGGWSSMAQRWCFGHRRACRSAMFKTREMSQGDALGDGSGASWAKEEKEAREEPWGVL
jgi:hypothetical protein